MFPVYHGAPASKSYTLRFKMGTLSFEYLCTPGKKKRLKIKISNKLASSADDIIIVEDFLFKILENVSIWKEILLTSRLKPKNLKT